VRINDINVQGVNTDDKSVTVVLRAGLSKYIFADDVKYLGDKSNSGRLSANP
jgi:hypothetical protein